ELVVSVEDGIRSGGAGSFMADAINSHAGPGRQPGLVILGTPLNYLAQAKPAQILARLGLDGAGIAASVRSAVRNTPDRVGD
ncbi:MAG: 1-deoxy-D-xylulose-5-phosphate synthase, partial [Acidimicrobiales bacterium]